MKIKNLNLDKSCGENWKNMSPDINGRFCQLCSKTVIDFTKLSSYQISKKINESKGNICARLTKQQLITPILDGEKVEAHSLPYSKVAAGIMLAASIATTQSCKKIPNTENTEYVSFVNDDKSKQNLHSNTKKSTTRNSKLLKGEIFTADSIPMHKAKVTFVTISKLYTVYTDKNGHFELEIPNNVINNKNVIRLSFDEFIPPKRDQKSLLYQEFYEDDDVILSQKNITTDFNFYAKSDLLYLGGIGVYDYEAKNNPLVFVDGVEVAFEEFQKSRFGEKSTCNLENKAYYHFEPEAAKVLCGDKAKHGLYLFYSNNL